MVGLRGFGFFIARLITDFTYSMDFAFRFDALLAAFGGWLPVDVSGWTSFAG